MLRVTGVLFALAGLCACGDPRTPFLGAYNNSWSDTYTVNGSQQNDTGSGSFTITTSATPSKIVITTNNCNYTATVDSPDGFTFDAITCATRSVSNCSSFVVSVTGGNGTLKGNTITYVASGSYSAVCYGIPGGGTFTEAGTATKL